MDTEEALWQAVGANPADSLPRLVLADWYEERAGVVECERCPMKHPGRIYTGKDGMKWIDCPHCHGTGRISNGYAETAAALRATADRVPRQMPLVDGDEPWCWVLWYTFAYAARRMNGEKTPASVGEETFAALTGVTPPNWPTFHDYPTALAAIRDLCAAWVNANKVEGGK